MVVYLVFTKNYRWCQSALYNYFFDIVRIIMFYGNDRVTTTNMH
jgi:hypothetical protein